jgi:hypothetical protein
MRILTGVWFGLGIVWFGFPYLDAVFLDRADFAAQKLAYARAQYNLFQSLITKGNPP